MGPFQAPAVELEKLAKLAIRIPLASTRIPTVDQEEKYGWGFRNFTKVRDSDQLLPILPL